MTFTGSGACGSCAKAPEEMLWTRWLAYDFPKDRVKAAAKELGFVYVDTGALYRTIGLYLLEHGLDPKDPAQVEPALPEIRGGADGMTRRGRKCFFAAGRSRG